MKLSAIVITKNNADIIERCLRSVRFADEVIVVDSASTDSTAQRAKAHGAQVFVRSWPGFGLQKNFALQQASGEWSLFIDADEAVTPELAAAIAAALQNPVVDFYWLRIVTVFLGKPLRHVYGHNPRLFKKTSGRWTDAAVHEQVTRADGTAIKLGDADTRTLTQPLIHNSHSTIGSYLKKMHTYTTLEAQLMRNTGKHRSGKRVQPTFWLPWYMGIKQTFKLLFYRQGILDGWAGIVWSILSGYYEFEAAQKYRLFSIERSSANDEGLNRVTGRGSARRAPAVARRSRRTGEQAGQDPTQDRHLPSIRIVHTCLRYPPATGGVETYVEQLVERTRNIQAGRDVRVLTSKLRTHSPLTELDPNLLLDDPPYVQRLFAIKTPFISYPRLAALSYYVGHHKPDIVHGYSFWYQPADVVARYARKHNLPCIFHPMYYENAQRRKLQWQLYKTLRGKQTFAAADAVVVISKFEQQLIEQAGFSVKKFVHIPPGIDTNEFQTTRENPYMQRGLTGNIVLAVSRLATGKGLEDLVKQAAPIIKQVRDTHFVIIGEDFGEKEALMKLANSSDAVANIHFWDKVSREDLIAAYQHATLLAHTSHYEAFGIVLIESMAAGRPVVARRVAAVPEVVLDSKTGLLFQTPEEMSDHIVSLLRDSSRAQALGEAGRTYVTETYTWEKSIQSLLNLYKAL